MGFFNVRVETGHFGSFWGIHCFGLSMLFTLLAALCPRLSLFVYFVLVMFVHSMDMDMVFVWNIKWPSLACFT